MPTGFYQQAPWILGAAGTLLGLGFFVLDELLGVDDWLIWSLASAVLAAGGVYLGLALRKLDRCANTDTLTGLKNRRYAHLRMTEELKRNNLVLSVAMVDVDNFKAVNDAYGHYSGDALLAGLADLIRRTVRDTDTVIRWGGDEFLVIFPQTGIDMAMAVAERIRQAAAEQYDREQVTLSIGVAAVPVDTDLSQALREVDGVLYQAKGCKNVVVTVPPGPGQRPGR